MPKTPIEQRQFKADALRSAQAGDLDTAESLLLRHIEHCPKDAEAWFFLGAVYGQGGRFPDSIRCCSQATRLQPNFPDAHFNLAQACMQQGQLEKATNAYQAVLRLQPNHFNALNNLGFALQKQKRFAEAIDLHQRAIHINPNHPDGHNHLGNALLAMGRRSQAEACFRQVLQLQPGHLEAISRLGNICYQKGRCQEAIDHYLDVLKRSPDAVDIHIDLGLAYLAQGRQILASTTLKHAVEMAPSNSRARSAYLFSLNYHSTDGRHIYDEHLRHGACLEQSLTPKSGTSRHRRLRIGYISTDFRSHSVAFFLLPILRNHDRSRFEITCYADVDRPDKTTLEIRQHSEHWRDVTGWLPQKIAELIHRDRIDILVDLAGHTTHQLLPVFCYRPAPIQVTYLGYPCTTGLQTMDYRLTDDLADPPGLTDQWHSEKLIRLPQGFLCYSPPTDAPEIVPPPHQTTGNITFGSFNNLAKVTAEVVNVWSRILAATPGSRIYLKSRQLDDDATRKRYWDMFSGNGIESQRVLLQGRIPEQHNHLGEYNKIDIALDTFPYNGTTTTCEALWMGVPIVTLAGNLHAGRVGLSLLANIGAGELAAGSVDEYCGLATQLAGDAQRLAHYRTKLRALVEGSNLRDELGFTRCLETAYQDIAGKLSNPTLR